MYAYDGLLFLDEDSGNRLFSSNNKMGILSVNLNNIYLDNDTNFDEDDPDTIILIRLFAY